MYKVTWTDKQDRHEQQETRFPDLKLAYELKCKSNVKVVTILREGGDLDFHPHPDNMGKFYLYQIVK